MCELMMAGQNYVFRRKEYVQKCSNLLDAFSEVKRLHTIGRFESAAKCAYVFKSASPGYFVDGLVRLLQY